MFSNMYSLFFFRCVYLSNYFFPLRPLLLVLIDNGVTFRQNDERCRNMHT